ncbi:hypothetical protein T10_12240 [Trichinella papuae]|uniref:Uncharacterized protein n=1 Tax=Trichinella papuae TaxID=268474 RepID=A0A0V1MZU6_9BILA|nr:hypothetical protein T10_12240 [Trichinella papuae]
MITRLRTPNYVAGRPSTRPPRESVDCCEKCITVKIIARSGWTVFLKTLLSKKYCDYSSSFRHYVFTRILRYSHAVLDCVSLKAEVWTCPDMSEPVDQSEASIWNRGTGAAVDQLPVSQRHLSVHPNRLFSLPVWLSRYHYCYDVEPHK